MALPAFGRRCLLALLLTAGVASAKDGGRPKVVLDRLDFPADVVAASSHKKRLRKVLAKEARRATWGAGRKAPSSTASRSPSST
ncbi:MAG: hypothetical protein R3B13_29545 [Polyangiaceae bacterium]